MITIVLNRNKCIGCSTCALICPFYFKLSKLDGKSKLLKSIKKKNYYILKNIKNKNYNNLIKASIMCPVKIIKVIKH
ncbi:MAG: ferredoxin [Candidatus Shikimatogenerans bostrichidophilus]|nr:MAG: ferredoxin [Candidatus Shikimatogenerans bostrichidophilus]